MNTPIWVGLALGMLVGGPPIAARAQAIKADAATATGIAGDWQAAFHGAGDPTRIVFRVSRAPAGWRAVVYWADESHYAASVPAVAVEGDGVSFTATARDLNGSFRGTLSPDHATMTGQWTQGAGGRSGFSSQPLSLARATKGNTWEIKPPLGSDAKVMAANLNPVFEVATVKPHDPSVPGGGWQWIGARRFQATMPVGNLLADIYGLQQSQIVGAPDWVFKDRYDYEGVPDLPGWPTAAQRYSMEKKLIEERFGLKTHMETRDMSALMLTAAKAGTKMTPSVIVDPGVTFGMRPAPGGGGMIFTAQNSSMGDFQRALQDMLNRPVVDKTGLEGQFDFDLTFLPDESMFGGHFHPPPNDNGSAPQLTTALQEQLGLKLNSFKGPVPVLVIDHIERPSSN